MIKINCIICGRYNTTIFWEKDGFSYSACPDCGLIYVNPRPSPEKLQNYYNRDYRVDRRRYLGRKKKWFDIMKILKKYRENGSILEIGCSYGLFLKSAEEKGFDVKGIEVSGDAAEYAVKNYGVDVEHGDLNEILEKSGESFDIICMWHTIEHINRPDHILLQLRRLLKDDGIVALTTPNIRSLPAKKMGVFWEWVNPPRHLFLFSVETITRLLQQQGYEVVEIFTRAGDYKAFILSLLTYPVRKQKYYNRNFKSAAIERTGVKGLHNINTKGTGINSSGPGGYWNLRLKEIFGMDFIFYYPYSFKNQGPEIFVIAKKPVDDTRENGADF